MLKNKRSSGSRGGYLSKALVLACVILVLAGGLTAWLGFFTGACEIKKVVVKGNRYLTREHIRDRSGVDVYTRLLSLPVGKLDENLEEDPWVKEASVGRNLPGTVRITVVEREPLAVVDFSGVGFLVSEECHVISQVAPGEFTELPRVYSGDASIPTVDGEVNNKKIRECVKVVGGMPATLKDALALANPFDGRGFVFISRNGYHIIYGASDDCSRKDEILEAIIVEINDNNRKVAYIDVTVPECPVIKPL